MIGSVYSRMPAVLGRRMIHRGTCLPWLAIQILPVRSPFDSIVFPEQSASTKFWNQQVDDILERSWLDSVGLAYC
jgi:hypothetical protein